MRIRERRFQSETERKNMDFEESFLKAFQENRWDGLKVILQEVQVVLEWQLAKLQRDSPKEYEDFKWSPHFFETLEKGDFFYSQLIEKEQLIKSEHSESLSLNPLLRVVKELVNEILEKNNSSSGNQIVYHYLKKYLSSELGASTATNPNIQNYGQWVKIYDLRLHQSMFFNSWMENLDREKIINELRDAEVLDFEKCSSPMGFRRNSEEFWKRYKDELESDDIDNVIPYLWKATRQSDLLDCCEEFSLRARLFLRVEVKEWLEFIDRISIPIIQDHRFLMDISIDQYPEILSLIVGGSYNSPKSHLFLLALDNYFRLLRSVTINLFQIKESGNPEEYRDWIQQEFPDRIKAVISTIWGIESPRNYEFIAIFTSWAGKFDINGSESDRLYSPNSAFQEVIEKVVSEFLTEKIADWQVIFAFIKDWDWSSFQKWILVTSNTRNKPLANELRILFEGKILGLTKNFGWPIWSFSYPMIKRANLIGWLLCFADENLEIYERWTEEFKVLLEGWESKPDSTISKEKESFILSVGIYISKYFFLDDKADEAKELIAQVVTHSISQYRIDLGSQRYYLLPLILAGQIIREYDKEYLPLFLSEMMDKMDRITHVLRIFQATFQEGYSRLASFSSEFRQSLLNLLDQKFFIIEERLIHRQQFEKRDFYRRIKNEIETTIREPSSD